jgi:hypothetical protein
MRPRSLLVLCLVLFAACGGSKSPGDSIPTTTTASPTPSVDLLEEARHDTCLDFKRLKNPVTSSTDIGDALADMLQEFANEARIDADLYGTAGAPKHATLLTKMANDAEGFQPGLRAEADAGVALNAYTGFVDGLLARLAPGTCDPELAA